VLRLVLAMLVALLHVEPASAFLPSSSKMMLATPLR
jgi:hypothetical protein